MNKLRLHLDTFWFSPYSFAAFVALKEKGVEFETKEVALHKKEHKEPSFLRRSVTGRIPALEHGDFFLAESSAIIEYIEDKFPAPKYPALLPKETEAKAQARMLLAWIRSSRDLMPLIEERSTATMFYDRATKPLSPKAQESADKLVEVAEFLIPTKGENLFGDWSIADSDLAFALHRLIINGQPIPDRLRKFAEHQWARPSVQAFVQHKRPPYVAYP